MSEDIEIDEFPVIDVDAQPQLGYEQMGSKDKFWIDFQGSRWLFKYPIRFDGERWSEMVAYHVGRMMGLPIAEVALGRHLRDDGEVELGTLSRTVLCHDRGEQLVHGNEAMEEMEFDDYVLDKEGQPGLDAVIDYLEEHQVAAPDEDKSLDAVFFFVGYLVLDALIGNVDRHHENWGVASRADGTARLVASFDHGACLGRELSEKNRRNRMEYKQVGGYVERRGAMEPMTSCHRIPSAMSRDAIVSGGSTIEEIRRQQ